MTATALAVVVALAASGPVDRGSPEPDSGRVRVEHKDGEPRFVSDVLVVGGTTAIFSLVNGSVRRGVGGGSLADVAKNFINPVGRAVEGAREDDDPFLTNYVAHPLSWSVLGLHLKNRGYGDWSALLLSQGHSFVWEYVIEGSYQKPSGKDLITNFAGAATAIFVVHRLSERAAEREGKRVQDRLLMWLNPLRPLSRLVSDSDRISVAAGPNSDGAMGVSLELDF